MVQLDSQSTTSAPRESLLHALSGPSKLPVCNYRRGARPKWVLNEELSNPRAARLQWNFRLDGKCNPLFLRGSRFLSSPRFFSRKDSLLYPLSSIPADESSASKSWKHSGLVRYSSRLTPPTIFIFTLQSVLFLFKRGCNILANFLGIRINFNEVG